MALTKAATDPARDVSDGAPDANEAFDRFERLVELVDELPDDEVYWTRDGKPSANALTELFGEVVSASERDAIWTEYQGRREDEGED